MKITRENFKNIVRETMIEESEYQEFFKKSLEKAGKSIPNMSDEEKKAFFNKIDSAWNGKGEKKESVNMDEAQSPAQKAAFQKMLDKKSGGDSKEDDKEEVDESIVEAAPKMRKDKRITALSKIVQELGSIERAPHEYSKGEGPIGTQGKKTIVKIAKLIGDLSSLIRTGR
jgi:hypothetical protein